MSDKRVVQSPRCKVQMAYHRLDLFEDEFTKDCLTPVRQKYGGLEHAGNAEEIRGSVIGDQ